MKKLLITLAIIIAIAAIGVAGYYLRGKQEAAVPTPQAGGGLPVSQNVQPQSAQPPQVSAVGANKFVLVSQSPVLDYAADKANNVFILQPDGRVSRIVSGKAESLSDTIIPGIISASFSYDGRRILAFTNDGITGNKLQIFDADKKSWFVFPVNAVSAAWSPDSHRFVFVSSAAAGSKTISIADADNQKTQRTDILTMNGEDIAVRWIYANTVMLADAPSAGWASSLWALNISQKTLSPVLLDKPGLEIVWSSSTATTGIAFYSNRNSPGGTLRFVNQSGEEGKPFEFVTFPSKCAFYDKVVQQQATSSTQASSTAQSKAKAAVPKPVLFLACALPRDKRPLDNAYLPDSYLKKELFTVDDFYEINTAAGDIKSVYSDQSKNLDADSVKIYNDALFFVNRYDKKLYSIVLPK